MNLQPIVAFPAGSNDNAQPASSPQEMVSMAWRIAQVALSAATWAPVSRGQVSVRGQEYDYVRLAVGSYRLTRTNTVLSLDGRVLSYENVVLNVATVNGQMRITGGMNTPHNIGWITFQVLEGRLVIR